MFYRITIDSWADALLLIEKMTDKVPDWAFRGQSDERWDLSTKFEREIGKYKIIPYWFYNREHYILQDFQRGAQQYVDNLPESKNYIGWLSLLQHYGGPTRLLDFTYSFYIALFFAVEKSNYDSAVWAVNINKLIRQLSKLNYLDLKKAGPSFGKIIKQGNVLAQESIENKKNKKDIVCIVEPFQQHERILKQQGLFLFPGNIEKSFEHNLCQTFEFNFKELKSNNASEDRVYSRFHTIDFTNASIIKIVIPSKLHSKAVLELRKMNITAAALFPGLDGFASSLSFRFGELDYRLHRTEDF